MKKFFTIVSLFITLIAIGQSEKKIILTASNFQVHGYAYRIRLDSIPGLSAFCELNGLSGNHTIKKYYFDYGEDDRDNENNVTDSSGNIIYFNSPATLINFLNYNGWQYKETVVLHEENFANRIEMFFSKKS